MKPRLQHIGIINRATFRRVVRRTVVLFGALTILLANVTLARAQETGLKRFFDGVRRGTAMPEVLRNVIDPSHDDSDRDAQQTSRGEGQPLRQPDALHAGDGSSNDGSGVLWQATSDAEPLPAPRLEGTVPIAGWDTPGDVDIARKPNGNISMVVRDASLSRVLSLLAQTYGLNIVAANDIDAIISITLHDVPLEQALTAILAVANYTWVQRNEIILITSLSNSAQLPADVQGRRIEVFELDFASASMIADAVTGFLSPIGTLAVNESDSNDNRRTRELVVVEDLPESLSRIAAYVHQVDQPPRQVLLEAHILQVRLGDTDKRGVNLDALFRVAGSAVNIKTADFASSTIQGSDGTPGGGATVTLPEMPSGFIATVQGGDLGAVIELLQTTNDAKTLGSPKLLVLDEQEARIQIGEKIAYQTTTTTQTTSTGGAAFIETGVILNIRPRITRDGRVLLHVAPEVSSASEDRPSADLPPDTSTTELETDVMLNDGQAMVIGGLIDETDSTTQAKVPYLGDVWGVGRLFKRSEVTKERREIIVAIVPRIQPYQPHYHAYEQGELVRAQTPLFGGPLCRSERPWEPVLPDGTRVAKPLIPPPPRWPQIDPTCDCVSPTPHYYVPRKPYPQQQFVDDYDTVVPAFPRTLRQAQPQISDGFASEFAGEYSFEGTVISDQP